MPNRYAICAMALFFMTVFHDMADAQSCDPTPERHAHYLGSGLSEGSLSVDGFPEIAGAHSFYAPVGPGWVFSLQHYPYGWSIRLYDRAGGDAVDMTSITPPFRTVPNPRDIEGWHFRNAANTGPNIGDVNAPQKDRLFVFSSSLSGTGGFKPPSGPQALSVTPADTDGRGWLKILDYGLSDLAPGDRARMTYLKFEACLTWPKSDDERALEAERIRPEFTAEDIEIFGACGLDLGAFTLQASILPRQLDLDIDGDGSMDLVAQIRRKSDDRAGLALCRAGTWLTLIGLDDQAGAGELRPGYIAQTEVWRRVDKSEGPFGYEGEPAWPDMAGDAIAIERVEKELYIVYWQDGALRAQEIYRFVGP